VDARTEYTCCTRRRDCAVSHHGPDTGWSRADECHDS
jgi:hypothetical protein